MAIFAIYKLLFDISGNGYMFADMSKEEAFAKSQSLLNEQLSKGLHVVKHSRNNIDIPLECYREKERDGVHVFVLCNEKKQKYKEKKEDMNLVYHPGCYVIIDNRPGVTQIAIERSTSFDSKTDTVRDLLVESLNKIMDPYQLTIDIRSKMREGEFWEVVDEQCKQFKDRIRKVIFDFPNPKNIGPLDAPDEDLMRLEFLYSVLRDVNGSKGTLKVEPDKDKVLILERSKQDFARLVRLCSRNGYDLSVHFKQYGVYRYGKEVKALDQMKDDVMNEFINGQYVMGKLHEGTWELIVWLDIIRQRTENYKDEETTKPTRKKSRKASAQR